MHWHDHRYSWKAFARCRGLIGEPQECVLKLAELLSHTNIPKTQYYNTTAQLSAELRWTGDKRPYYDVYPSVTEAFIKIDLSKINASQVALPIKDLLIRFQAGHEFQASPRTNINTILVSETQSYQTGGRGILLSINDGSMEEWDGTPVPIHTVRGIVLDDNLSIEEHLLKGRNNTEKDFVDEEAVSNVMRLIVALCLLKDNPDLIEPQPLEADRDKWLETHDAKYLDKAARRGKRGWSVGKHIEIAPGFRRPHFAIRWCGKGALDPQLRPIKGCLVRRQSIEEIPTGYLDS